MDLSLWPYDSVDSTPAEASLYGGLAAAGGSGCEGSAVFNKFEPATWSKTGLFARSFEDDFYHRVWLVPAVVAPGLLIESLEYEVFLWNAFFDRTVTLSEIQSDDPDGTSLVFAAPQDLPPTGEVSGVLTLLAAGPAVQDSSYTFVTSENDPVMSVSTERVLPFGYEPNWNEKVSVGLAFETVINSTFDLVEQRRSRINRPIRTISGTVLEDGIGAQRLRNMLLFGMDRIWAAPVWTEPVLISGISSEGVVSCTSDITDFWHLNRLCNTVVLIDEENDLVLARTIVSVDPGAGIITLLNPVTETFDPVSTVIYPAIISVIDSQRAMSRTAEVDEWSLSFKEYGGSSQPEFSGLPDLPERIVPDPDWSSPVDGTNEIIRILNGYPGTAQSIGALVNSPPEALEFQVTNMDKAEEMDLLDLAAGARGRWKRFWLEGPRRAFGLAESAESEETSIKALDNGFLLTWKGHERIYIESGEAVQSRKIVNAVEGDPGQIVLHLDAALDADVPVGAWIGREYLMRFDLDEIELTYETMAASSTNLRFLELVKEYE